jgi:tetrachloro-p-hydroquinone reductive dehalogenase
MLELFHAAPSYYSMVARLALAEAGVSHASRLLDIHLARQQLSDAYRLLNPQMTVPTLRGPGLLLTDSRTILSFAAEQAGERWADAERREGIAAAVAGHYAISIETLTFSKLLASKPLLQPLVVRLLSGLSRSLEARALTAADGGASLRAKAEQNRQRLHTFTQAPPAQTLDAMRRQVRAYLTALPAPGGWLFGERISSADVVLAVLVARLSMAGELALLSRSDLQQWWARYQQRPAFAAADIWTRFQRRRFLQGLLEARRTRL